MNILSAGALNNILADIHVDNPVLQILGTKKLTSFDGDHYCLFLSDGVTNTDFTVLATEFNEMVDNGELTDHSIIQITQYDVCNVDTQEQRKMIKILGIEVKVPGNQTSGVIGQSVQQENTNKNTQKNRESNLVRSHNSVGNQTQKRRLNDIINMKKSITTSSITNLIDFQKKRILKVRVGSKSHIRIYNTLRKETLCFNMLVEDESGQIKCIGFSEAINKFYEMLEVSFQESIEAGSLVKILDHDTRVGGVYYLSGVTFKAVNREKYDTDNNYEIYLTSKTEIKPAHDANDYIELNSNLTQISQIENQLEQQVNSDLGYQIIQRQNSDENAFTDAPRRAKIPRSKSDLSGTIEFQNKWTIKVKIVKKSEVETWSESLVTGCLFNMILIDSSGEIMCTGFLEAVTKYYDYIEVGEVYYLTGTLVKPANKEFYNIKNDFELTLDRDSIIVPCYNASPEIPMLSFNFIAISEIEHLPKDKIIDVLGIVKTFSPVQAVTAKNTGRELFKRDLSIVDASNTLIVLTVWEEAAKEFDAPENAIIAVKGAKICEFNNRKNLSALLSTVVLIDPDLPEAHSLRGWYNTVGQNEEAKSLSKVGGSGPSAEWSTLQEGLERGRSAVDNPLVFLCKGTISMIKGDRALYKACPVKACKKKVVDQSNGMFRCEKCQQEYPNFRYCLLTNMHVTDWSDNQWITAFADESEKILGMTSQELGELNKNQPDDYNDRFSSVAFNSYIFKLSLKMETYNDKSRMKGIVRSVDPIDYKSYNKHLVNEIKKLANVHNVSK